MAEPQTYACDIDLVLRVLSNDYCWTLSSADQFDPELPLLKPKAFGGTMILWKEELDPFITVVPTSSTAFSAILFHPTASVTTAHFSVYLPTSGREREFFEEISKLSLTIDSIMNTHPDAIIYLRGDFNVSSSNTKRSDTLSHFCNDHDLRELSIPHKTYHHFMGNGKSDSNLDRIFFSSTQHDAEILLRIHCKLSEPLIDSHHDLLISRWFPQPKEERLDTANNIRAPLVENKRMKVVWTDDGIEEFQKLVSPHLLRIQHLWLQNPTKTCISLLLQSTNELLTTSASATNKTFLLDGSRTSKSKSVPKPVRLSQNALRKLNKNLRKALEQNNECPDRIFKLKEEYNKARIIHRKLERRYKALSAFERDQNLSRGPTYIFHHIRSARRSKSAKIQKLLVDKKTYHGESVKDGFFESISQLKSRGSRHPSPLLQEFTQDYRNILEICKKGRHIPPISEKDSFELLQKMKADVTDIYGVTVNHFYYAGPLGWQHFHVLLNTLISNINSTTIEEVNTVYACILFKGHKKEKSLSSSYRTISSCPVVAKALDLYVKNLNFSRLNIDQSEVQFQGQGSSHELASVLLTETIQHSLFSLKQPVYVLYLDAQSAFDVVLPELLVRKLHQAGITGQSLLYINNRLCNRNTVVDWNGQHMGPVLDERGLEQGGVSASELYKVFGKEQLTLSQESKLGVPLTSTQDKDLIISAIGQADDTLLVSNSIRSLQYLLYLTETFCNRNQVSLSPGKTKLQVFFTPQMRSKVKYAMITNPVKLKGIEINFSETAEHVGVLRSTSGNSAAIFSRITAHRNALAAVLHTGMALNHRGNPAASLTVEQLYGLPVLISGLASLYLSKAEESIISQHHKETIRALQRLLPGTPTPVVCFLAGSLPGSAHIHLRQLSIFGMVTRLSGNFLHKYALKLFQSGSPPAKSWFSLIQNLCHKYSLPSPLELLESPKPKFLYKNLVKKKVISFWENSLRAESETLKSLKYFNPYFMSLTKTHPIWTTATSSPAKVAMATVQAVMISGRYRTESLCSKWKPQSSGCCLLSQDCSSSVEDLEHILRHCTALDPTRAKLTTFSLKYCDKTPNHVASLITKFLIDPNPEFCQFLLDCSTIPEVIKTCDVFGRSVLNELFNVTRTWVYTLHKDRLRKLGRWRH